MYEVFGLRYTLAHYRPLPIETLETIVADMGRGDEAENATPVADMSFHTALINATGLSRLISAWSGLTPQLQMLLHRRTVVGAADVEAVWPAHIDLLNALRTYDASQAEQALRSHIDGSYQALVHHWPDESGR
jgi:DNA-binding FadR family transcriptional regulator